MVSLLLLFQAFLFDELLPNDTLKMRPREINPRIRFSARKAPERSLVFLKTHESFGSEKIKPVHQKINLVPRICGADKETLGMRVQKITRKLGLFGDP